MITVKLSYSIMKAWARGSFEDAVSMYMGGEIPQTPAIVLGRLKDEVWTKYSQEHKCLHPELGGNKLHDPVLQQKYEKLIPLGDKYQILLRGRPDCVDGDMIHDFKCGSMRAVAYVDEMQFDYYKLLLPHLRVGFYECYDPYFEELTIGIKFLSSHNAKNALNHLLSNASELIPYLESQRLLKDYYKTKKGVT